MLDFESLLHDRMGKKYLRGDPLRREIGEVKN